MPSNTEEFGEKSVQSTDKEQFRVEGMLRSPIDSKESNNPEMLRNETLGTKLPVALGRAD